MRRASRLSPAAREVERTDRRWFLAAAVVFGVSLGVFFGAHRLYRATGPHPEIYSFFRRVRGFARRLLPRWRRLKADR
jgi:hypothetical protein